MDIEFLLISVIQGVALAALSSAAVDPITHLDFIYWPYIFSGFIFILAFWSQAIIHAISFIDWPLNLGHSFLYFLTSFIEVVCFSQIKNPLWWFGLISVFFITSFVLYFYDLRIIRFRQSDFQRSKSGLRIYKQIIKSHTFEMKYFLSGGLVFNLAAAVMIYLYPNFFIDQQFHLGLVILQVAFGLIYLVNSLKNFKVRSSLIWENSL